MPHSSPSLKTTFKTPSFDIGFISFICAVLAVAASTSEAIFFPRFLNKDAANGSDTLTNTEQDVVLFLQILAVLSNSAAILTGSLFSVCTYALKKKDLIKHESANEDFALSSDQVAKNNLARAYNFTMLFTFASCFFNALPLLGEGVHAIAYHYNQGELSNSEVRTGLEGIVAADAIFSALAALSMAGALVIFHRKITSNQNAPALQIQEEEEEEEEEKTLIPERK